MELYTSSVDPIMTALPMSSQEHEPPLELELLDLTLVDVDSRILDHQATIKHLEATIMHHHRSIMKLRERRNKLTAYTHNRLPEEILSQIFQTVRNDAVVPDVNGYNWVNTADFYSWVVVLHVCRLWRNVGFADSSLFSNIMLPTRNPDLFDVLLKYSREANLNIVVTNYIDPTDEAWKKLWPHLPRMKSLYLTSHPPPGEWPVCPAVTQFYCWPGAFDESPIPWAAVMHEIMPSLKVLNTSTWCYGPNWCRYPLPSSLAHLSVTHSRTNALSTTTVEGLIQSLANTTRLKSLDMSNLANACYSSHQSSGISSSLVISHFKSIILQGALAPIIGLLSHVVNVEKLHLTLTSFPSDNIISLPRIVRNALPSIENISPTALNHRVQFTIDTMQTDRVLDFRLSIWTNASPVISKDPFSGSPDIRLSFCPDNLATTLTVAQQLSEQLSHYLVPATHARFRISGGCGRPGSEMLILRYMAETLTHVTHIDLVLGDIRDLSSTNIIAALPSLFMSPHSDTRTALFLKLMVLRIDANMLLGCSRVQPLCAFFKSLHAVLANRYELGFKLQSLEFDASRCINLPLTFDGADPLVSLNLMALQDVVGEIITKMPL